MPPKKWHGRDPATGEPLPYMLFTAGDLEGEARKRAQELRTARSRTPQERRALAEDTAHLLRACADALAKLRMAARGNH